VAYRQDLTHNLGMPSIRVKLWLVPLGLLCLNIALAQSSPEPASERLQQIRARLATARRESNWPAYLAGAREQSEFLDGSPLSRLEIARAQMRLGDERAARDDLHAYVRMGQASSFVDSSPEFAPLREKPGFAPIHRRLLENRLPVSRASVAVRLADSGLLPEDIDYDAKRRRFMITSVLEHKVVSVDFAGKMVDFATAPDGWPMMALKIDPRRELLWATEVAMNGFTAVPKAERGRSLLLCYDLQSGHLVRRIEGPRPTALADIALSADGDVIASDGDHGGVYRLKFGSDQWERLDAGDFISPQTPALAADGKHLYVPDYTRGIGVMDIQSKQVKWIPAAGRFALGGIDGMYKVSDGLIAVQNGTDPERVIQFKLDPSASRIVSEAVIERSTVTLGDPTHAVVIAGTLYYIANPGWDVLTEAGEVEAGKKLTASVIMRARIEPL
jgi:sugar lactone lactonase YvrE